MVDFRGIPHGYQIIPILGKHIVVSTEDEGFSSIPFWEGGGLQVN